MPNANNSVRYQQWRRCDRCGFMFPIGDLILQKGLMVSPRCVDNLDVETRPKVIAEVLSDTEETRNEMERIFDSNNDQLIQF